MIKNLCAVNAGRIIPCQIFLIQSYLKMTRNAIQQRWKDLHGAQNISTHQRKLYSSIVIVLYLLIIQEFNACNTTTGYRACPKHTLF